MSLVLIRPDIDIWEAGEHNGTFRGNNLAFVTGSAALSEYWKNDVFETQVNIKGKFIAQKLKQIVSRYPQLNGIHRGLGAIQGIDCCSELISRQISRSAFERGLIVETAGRQGEVVKLLPPLTIDFESLTQGLDILEAAVEQVMYLEKAS